MSSQIDIGRLASLLKAKRGKRKLREVATEIGEISASTLSRIEAGKIPDLDSLVRICKWIGIKVDDLLQKSQSEGVSTKLHKKLKTPEIVEAHLRADRTLSQETTDALAEMIRLAYRAAAKGKLHNKGS